MRRFSMMLCALLVPAALTLGACNGDDDGDGNGDDGDQDVGVTDVDEMDVDQEPDADEQPDADEAPDADDEPDVDEGDVEGDAMADGGDGDPCADEGICEVSGSLQFHPVSQELDSEATLGGARLFLSSAGAAIAGNPNPMENEAGDPVEETWATEATEMMVEWGFDTVDVSSIATGIVSIVEDSGDLSEQKFVTTATGLAGEKPTEPLTDAGAHVLTVEAEGQLANLVADASEGDDIQEPGDLAAEGFILLQFLDSEGDPVAGVTATDGGHDVGSEPDDTGDRIEEAYYPNADYSSATRGPFATTSETGVAILPGADTLSEFGGVDVEAETNFELVQARSLQGVAFIGFRTPVSDDGG